MTPRVILQTLYVIVTILFSSHLTTAVEILQPDENDAVRVIAGAIWKNVEDVTLYEANIPLLYSTTFHTTDNLSTAECKNGTEQCDECVEPYCNLYNPIKKLGAILDRYLQNIERSELPENFSGLNGPLPIASTTSTPDDTTPDKTTPRRKGHKIIRITEYKPIPTHIPSPHLDTIYSHNVSWKLNPVNSKVNSPKKNRNRRQEVTPPADENDNTTLINITSATTVKSTSTKNTPYIGTALGWTARSRREVKPHHSTFLGWCCGAIDETTFSELATEQQVLKEQVNRLTSGLQNSLKSIFSQTPVFSAFEKDIKGTIDDMHQYMRRIETAEQEQFTRISGKEDATHTNLIGLYSLIHRLTRRTAKVAQLLSNQETLASCRQHQIPAAVLPPDVLYKDLQRLEETLRAEGHQLAIPIDRLGRYYKLSLCDCAFSQGNITLHLRIPIIRENQHWTLMELVLVPFAWNNQKCILQNPPLFLAVSQDPTNPHIPAIVRPITGLSIHECKPHRDRMCYVSRFSPSVNEHGTDCARVLYEGSTFQEISQVCSFRCISSTAMSITEIAENVFMLTHPLQDMRITCPNHVQLISNSTVHKPGAIQMLVPCECKLETTNLVIIPRRFPCGSRNEKLQITHVIPSQWCTPTTLRLDPRSLHIHPLEYTNYTEVLDQQWNVRIPHLNLTAQTDLSKTLGDVRTVLASTQAFGEGLSASFTYHGDLMQTIWNILLTLTVMYLFARLHGVTTIMAYFGMTRAETKIVANHYDHVYIIVMLFVCLFILFILGVIGLERYVHRRIRERRRGRNGPSNDVPLQPIYDINSMFDKEEGALLMLPDGQRIRVNIMAHDAEEWEKLDKCASTSATLPKASHSAEPTAYPRANLPKPPNSPVETEVPPNRYPQRPGSPVVYFNKGFDNAIPDGECVYADAPRKTRPRRGE